MNIISFVLNLPWTILGVLFSLLSIPYEISFNRRPFAFVIKIKSFWWYKWLPGTKGIRGMAIGNVVMLGPNVLPKDLEHELIHIEQMEREPLIHPLLYTIENLQRGYRNNKYEKEAYGRAGNVYLDKN